MMGLKYLCYYLGLCCGFKLRHRHDYEMEFIGSGLECKFVCSCGDVAPSMDEALKRMGKLRCL